MKHGPAFGGVDHLAREHRRDLVFEVRRVSQAEELVQGLGGGVLARVVEENAAVLGEHRVGARRVGQEIAEVCRFDVGGVVAEGVPGRGRADQHEVSMS